MTEAVEGDTLPVNLPVGYTARLKLALEPLL